MVRLRRTMYFPALKKSVVDFGGLEPKWRAAKIAPEAHFFLENPHFFSKNLPKNRIFEPKNGPVGHPNGGRGGGGSGAACGAPCTSLP